MGKGSLADARDSLFACGLCQGSARLMLMMLALLAFYGKGAVWLMLMMLDLAACVKAQPG